MTNGIFNTSEPTTEVRGATAMRCAAHFVKLATAYPQFVLPISHAHRVLVNGDMARGGAIAGLSINRGPMAVVRLIVAIVVDAVNRVKGRWLASHVGQERLKIVKPPFTYLDAASAVSGIFRVGRIEAPALKRRPRFVFKAVAFAMKVRAFQAVDFNNAFAMLRLSAAAAIRSLSQIGASSYSKIAAIAAALPHGIARSFNNGSAKHGKAPKFLARKINKPPHNPSFMIVPIPNAISYVGT